MIIFNPVFKSWYGPVTTKLATFPDYFRLFIVLRYQGLVRAIFGIYLLVYFNVRAGKNPAISVSYR